MAEEKPIGKVIHYYDKAMVAVVKFDKAISVGDAVKFVYHDKEFSQTIESMEINHEKVQKVKSGGEAAIKVDQPAHQGALVYKI